MRYAIRTLFASPGFTAVAILSLAIGIGVNTAVFGIVRTLLLESLRVERPEELALIYRSTPNMRTMQVNSSGYRDAATGASFNSNFSYSLFRSLQENARQSADIFGYNFVRQLSVSIDGQPSIIAGGMLASGNYFAALKPGIIIGRGFDEVDDVPGAHVAVISHSFWLRAFGGDASAAGKSVVINGTPFQIIGVTGAGFQGLSAGGFFPPTEVTLPLSVQPIITPRWADAGVSMFTAQDRFWVRADRTIEAEREAGLIDPNGSELGAVRLLPGNRGLDSLRRDTERPLYLLTGVVVLVLLIACVNLASLMLARGVARQREIAVRQALGGSRFRLISQLMAESLLLALAGGVAGLLLALWTGPIITSMVTAGLGPVAMEFNLDWRLLATTAVLAVAAALLFSLLPAVKLTSLRDPGSFLGQRSTGGMAPRLTVGRVLVAVQVAVSIPLVVGAGLFLRTVQNLGSVDLGFDPQGLILFRLDPTLNDNDPEKHSSIYQQVLQRLEAIPGVRSATLIENPLISGITSNTNVTIGEQQGPIYKNAVGPRFFETAQMPIVAGRALGLQDNAGSARVIVINETAARKYFSGSPIGRRIRYGSRDDEIVGVVADSKYYSLRQAAPDRCCGLC